MTTLRLDLNGDNCWPEGRFNDIIRVPPENLALATLDAGMASGRPSLAIRVDLPDGKVVFVETSVKLFLVAAAAIRAKYPDAEL